MKTSIIGYPRVGSLRELKFTTEKYFRGENYKIPQKKSAKPSGHYRKIPGWISFRQMIFLSMI